MLLTSLCKLANRDKKEHFFSACRNGHFASKVDSLVNSSLQAGSRAEEACRHKKKSKNKKIRLQIAIRRMYRQGKQGKSILGTRLALGATIRVDLLD